CTNTTKGKVYPITSGPAGGSGFAGTVTMGNGNKVSAITITGSGTGYSAGSGNITFTNNTGGTCTLAQTFTLGSPISRTTVAAGGSYMTQPTITLGGTSPASPSSPTLPALTATPNPWPANASGISAINVTAPGSGYTPGTHYALTITGGG